MLDITLLGTSALLPLPGRAETAAALRCAGHTILFDCGEGTQTAARAAHVSLLKADIIALTHYHGDHIFGLPGLLSTMSVLGRTEPLTLIGPAGIRQALSPILELTGPTSYELRLLELPEKGVRLCGIAPGWPKEIRLRAFPTDHTVLSQGYAVTLERPGRFLPERAAALNVPKNLWGRLQKGEAVPVGDVLITPEQVLGAPRRGLKFVFSGDSRPCDALTEAAMGADLLICDATYGEDEQAGLAREHGHMTFSQAAETAARAGVRRLWLAHYSQMMKDPAECLPTARAIFPAAECGKDGMSTRLEFDREE